MTVGELVLGELDDLLPRGEVVVGSQFCAALRSLGIWDAEVREGTASIWQEAGGAERYGIRVADRLLAWEGDAVRIIVLPCSKKENECSGKGNE